MVLQELIQNYFMLNRLAYQEKRNKEKNFIYISNFIFYIFFERPLIGLLNCQNYHLTTAKTIYRHAFVVIL